MAAPSKKVYRYLTTNFTASCLAALTILLGLSFGLVSLANLNVAESGSIEEVKGIHSNASFSETPPVAHAVGDLYTPTEEESQAEDTSENNLETQAPQVKILRRSDFGPRPPSAYEQRWPGWALPEWAQKPFFFRVPIPDGKRGCYVHVGKTAGSTVGCSLGFQLHCDNSMTYPVGVLSNYVATTLHNDVNDCPHDVNYYLFIVRNPLKRIQSAYVYDRPHTPNYARHGTYELYYECEFWTLNDLAEKGLAEDGEASEVCKKRAYDAIRGNKRFGYHLFFNYGYYKRESIGQLERPIMAIRTEHLQDDWGSAEAQLSGNPVYPTFPRHNERPWQEADHYLSDKARFLLCQGLCKDIIAYRSILNMATNLTPEQVEETMNELYDSCPRDALSCLE